MKLNQREIGMGIRLFSADSYPDEKQDVPILLPGNPNSANYRIIETLTFGNILIIEIEYPDCKNYEGRKLLVYEGISSKQLIKQKLIDPHFSENKKHVSPIARFEPTTRGWAMATSFAKIWSVKK